MTGDREPGLERFCPECGEPLGAVQAQCPRCARSRQARTPSREGVLFASLILLGLLFVVTSFVSRAYHGREQALAEHWFAEGDRQLKRNDVKSAIGDIRTALVYSPDNPAYQLRLAQALAADGRNDEARAYLLNFLAQDPGNGQANLEMAHLAVRAGSVPEAERYFRNAIYGVWEKDAVEASQRARLDLCIFLLSRNLRDEAKAELLALADTVPPENAAFHAELGNLFQRAGDASRAFGEFRLALRSDRSNPNALAGAGMAAFQLGEYYEARRYFERMYRGEESEDEEEDAGVAPLLAQTRLLTDADPLAPGLSGEERRRRLSRAVDTAVDRLQTCATQRNESLKATPPETDLQRLSARAKIMRLAVRERNLSDYPERISEVLNLVFDIEKTAAQECGPPQGMDQTLLLLAKVRRNAER